MIPRWPPRCRWTPVAALAALPLLAHCRAERAPRAGADSAATAAPAAASAASASKACGVASGTVLTDSGIGDLVLGASTAALKARCTVVADTVRPGAEGEEERVLLVALDGDTLTAEIVADRVWRIAIAGPGPRTAESLGVGTPLVAFRRLADLRLEFGEGWFLLTGAHCGLSFRLPNDAVPDSLMHLASRRGADLAPLADSLRVQEVLVFGCPAR